MAAKGALVGLTRGWAMELGGDGTTPNQTGFAPDLPPGLVKIVAAYRRANLIEQATVNLTDAAATDAVFARVRPEAVVHLAAIATPARNEPITQLSRAIRLRICSAKCGVEAPFS